MHELNKIIMINMILKVISQSKLNAYIEKNININHHQLKVTELLLLNFSRGSLVL